jgi:hypothetical protein
MPKLTTTPDELSKGFLFSDVPHPTLKKVAALCEIKEYSTGVTFIVEGDTGDSMYLVLEGKAQVLKAGKPAKIILKPHDLIGEGSLLSGTPRSASIVSITPMKVAIFNQEVFKQILILHPSIPVKLMKIHNARFSSIVKSYNPLMSKGIWPIVLMVLIILLKNLPNFIQNEALKNALVQLTSIVPDQYMTFLAPASMIAFFKLHKMDIKKVQSKLEHL